EAPVERIQDQKIDLLDRLILRAADLSPDANSEQLNAVLHLGPQLIEQALRQLAGARLVEQKAEGWSVTAEGKATMEQGEYRQVVQERRPFYFLADAPENSLPFLPIVASTTTPWQPEDNWAFDVRILESCVRQANDWKEHHGFPVDVQCLLRDAKSA